MSTSWPFPLLPKVVSLFVPGAVGLPGFQDAEGQKKEEEALKGEDKEGGKEGTKRKDKNGEKRR